MCGPDLWVGDTKASPLGIPGWRKEAGPRAGALSPSLPCQGPHCVLLAGPCPSVGLDFHICEMEEALDQTVCHVSFSFCDMNPMRSILPALMGRWVGTARLSNQDCPLAAVEPWAILSSFLFLSFPLLQRRRDLKRTRMGLAFAFLPLPHTPHSSS